MTGGKEGFMTDSKDASKDRETRDSWWARLLKWLADGAEKSRKSSGCFT